MLARSVRLLNLRGSALEKVKVLAWLSIGGARATMDEVDALFGESPDPPLSPRAHLRALARIAL